MPSPTPLRSAVLAAFLAFPAPGARAQEAATLVSAEATLRLVAAAPDAEGLVRAALLVDLAPGWKTYWRDPGDAGIPPTLDFSASRNLGPAIVRYPAPHRFGDDYGTSNGYSEPMAFAIELPETQRGNITELRLKLMLGVCQKICVPLSAELALPLPSADGTEEVVAAFASLPALNQVATGIRDARLSADGKALVVQAAASVDASSDLFVAGPKGWSFGAPEAAKAESGMVFTLPVLARPRKPQEGPLLVDAVLASGEAAVEARALAVGSATDGSTAAP